MPTAYAYVRVSTPGQAESGLGEDAQINRIADYYKRVLGPQGVRWGQTFSDPAVSARKVDLRDRPEGKRMDRTAQRGDVIMVAKLERAFRQNRDMYSTLDSWKNRGVRVVLLDVGEQDVDMDSFVGVCMLSAFGLAATIEGMRASERGKERIKAGRRTDRSNNGRAPHGFRVGTHYKKRVLYPDPLYRHLVATMLRWRDQGHPPGMIHRHLLATDTKNPKTGRLWTHPNMKRVLAEELDLRRREAAAGADGVTKFLMPSGTIRPIEEFPHHLRLEVQKDLATIASAEKQPASS